eukprot:974091-Prymnesium_polylepis.2
MGEGGGLAAAGSAVVVVGSAVVEVVVSSDRAAPPRRTLLHCTTLAEAALRTARCLPAPSLHSRGVAKVAAA